jgi:signal peptidase II
MPGQADAPRAARPLPRLAALYGTAAAVLAADQLTKYLVVRNLEGRAPVRVIGSFVELRYTTNSGGAFSLLTGAPLFFVVMAVVIIGGIVHAGRRAQGLPVLLALGLVLGGALGNLADRLFRGDSAFGGEVVNLADSCIVVGGLLLVLLFGRADRAERQRDRPAADADPRAPDAP